MDQEQKEKLPAITVGLTPAGVWKDVPQNSIPEGQNVPQDDVSEGQNVPQNDSFEAQNTLPEIEDIIVNLIKKNNKITREEIGKKINASEKTVGRYIAKMEDKVVFVGRGQNGHWKIVEAD